MTESTERDEAAFGIPRFKDGPEGRCVRLGALVRWLMREHEATRESAVLHRLLPIIRGPNPPTFYFMRLGGDALPMPANFSWFPTANGLAPQRRRMSSRGLGPDGQLPPIADISAPAEALGYGVDGLSRWLQHAWASPDYLDAHTIDCKGALAAAVAVSESDARALWGFRYDRDPVAEKVIHAVPGGTFPLRDFAELVAYRTHNPGTTWNKGNQLDLLHMEFDRLGGLAAAHAEVGLPLNLTRQFIAKLLTREFKRSKIRRPQ